MALRPVVTLGDGLAVLSLDVALGIVVGWDVQSTVPVRVQVAAGAFGLRQTLAPGAHAAPIGVALRWSYDTGEASYSLSLGG